jgi:hypothetical protein
MSQPANNDEEQEELLHFNQGVDPSNLVNVLNLMELTFAQAIGLLGLFVIAALLACSVVNAFQALTFYYYPDADVGKQAWMCLIYACILIIAFAVIEKILGVNKKKNNKSGTKNNNNNNNNKKVTIGTVRQ